MAGGQPYADAQAADALTGRPAAPGAEVPSGQLQQRNYLGDYVKNIQSMVHDDPALGTTGGYAQGHARAQPALYYKKGEAELLNEIQPLLAKTVYDNMPAPLQAVAKYDIKIPPEYLSWVQQKRDASTHAAFDAYIETKYFGAGNADNVAFQEFIKKNYPEYFEARLENARSELALINKITELKIKGAYESWDLFILQWMLDAGLLVVPTKMPWAWQLNVADQQKGLVRGFLSTKRFAKLPSAAGGGEGAGGLLVPLFQ
jgi:hypothetical protein